jgi:PEP-CTERM motif
MTAPSRFFNPFQEATMKLQFAVIAAASALAFNAQADTTDWGVHAELEIGVNRTPVGSFEDIYLFSFAEPLALFNTTVANNQFPILQIDSGTVTLFQEAGAVDVALGNFSFNGTTGSTTHAFGALGIGDYYYQVAGIGAGTRGGFYTLSSTATPVPEPETYALMLSGLGVVGFLALRRRARTESR